LVVGVHQLLADMDYHLANTAILEVYCKRRIQADEAIQSCKYTVPNEI